MLGFLNRKNTQWIDLQEETMSLRTFQENVGSGLVSAKNALEIDLLQSSNGLHYRLN